MPIALEARYVVDRAKYLVEFVNDRGLWTASISVQKPRGRKQSIPFNVPPTTDITVMMERIDVFLDKMGVSQVPKIGRDAFINVPKLTKAEREEQARRAAEARWAKVAETVHNAVVATRR